VAPQHFLGRRLALIKFLLETRSYRFPAASMVFANVFHGETERGQFPDAFAVDR
jgi:hypothetical protein